MVVASNYFIRFFCALYVCLSPFEQSITVALYTVYGKRSFLSKESDTLRFYRVYISPTM